MQHSVCLGKELNETVKERSFHPVLLKKQRHMSMALKNPNISACCKLLFLTRSVLISAVSAYSSTTLFKSNWFYSANNSSVFPDLFLYCTYSSLLMQIMTEDNTFILLVHVIYHNITGAV